MTNKERANKVKRKFKAALIAVLFVQRLKTNMRGSLLRRKKKAEKYSKHFVSLSEKLIHRYYENLLREEFQDYISIL